VVWEVPSGRKVWVSTLKGLVRIGWSAGGELVGIVRDKGAVIFRGLESGEGRRLAAADVADPRYASAYCPARSLLAIGGEGSLIPIWDVTTGRERFTFDTKAGAATAPPRSLARWPLAGRPHRRPRRGPGRPGVGSHPRLACPTVCGRARGHLRATILP